MANVIFIVVFSDYKPSNLQSQYFLNKITAAVIILTSTHTHTHT
jgi:hypothetical protein